MDATAETVWHAFLHTLPLDKRKVLLQSLSPEFLTHFEQLSPVALDVEQGIEPVEKELSKIHFSWLAPLLRSLPKNEINLFVSCLSSKQIQELKTSLLFITPLPTPSKLGQEYLRKTFFDLIAEPNLLPIACLPANPLNALLNFTCDELISLIDLLSMHDLSIEIRQIIQTAKLRDIYGLLTKAQKNFLKTLVHKKEIVSFKKMGLLNWKGDREGLLSLLIQRGINRIAKALYGHHPSLLWHLAHRLDVEKGQILINLCTPLDHPRASVFLSQQVIELIDSFKSPNPSKPL